MDPDKRNPDQEKGHSRIRVQSCAPMLLDFLRGGGDALRTMYQWNSQGQRRFFFLRKNSLRMIRSHLAEGS